MLSEYVLVNQWVQNEDMIGCRSFNEQNLDGLCFSRNLPKGYRDFYSLQTIIDKKDH